MRKVRDSEPATFTAPPLVVADGLMLAIDPGLRTVGATVATMAGSVVDAWLPRSPEQARTVKGLRVPAAEGPVAWRAMVGAVLDDLRERGHLHRIALLVVEWPEVYREAKKGKLKGANPNALLDLAAVDGGLACALPALARYERFTPRQWKRNFPKGDYQRAILAALTPEERAMVERTTESLRHNVVESVGLARFMATVLAGAPMSVPAFQGRAKPTRKAPVKSAPLPQQALPLESTPKAPAYKTPLPPGSRAGTPSYGSRHAADFKAPRGSLKKVGQQLRGLATSASHPAPVKP